MMPTTNEDILLLNCLAHKVKQFKLLIAEGRPYVWELRLSLEDFYQLETALNNSCASHDGNHNHLICEDFAPIVVIYLAEWYKRFYKGTDTADSYKAFTPTTEELKSLFRFAHIDEHVFVYNASKNPDKTSFRWLESLQILGGLAIQVELKRASNDTLLLQLCKIFHGEDIEIDNLNDRNRAVAFQESISRQHSLYEYLQCILDKEKDMPFANEDLDNEDTKIPQFIERIRTADREAKKNKFDFEWIIAYTARCNQMVRTLKVKLKPEVIGGRQKQYIGYDRLRTPEWGLEQPENVGRLDFFIQFKKGKKVISQSAEPLFKYHNTGSETTGFLGVGKMDETIYTDVPASFFDRVEIVLEFNGFKKVVQTLKVDDYMQVYLLKGTSNKFSSRKNAQATTAVIFSSAYRLAEAFRDIPVVYAHFKNKEFESEDYCWCPINDKVVLIGPDNKELMPPFFNRNGLYQVLTRKYLRTIKYKENTFVLYKYIDTDYDEEEVLEDEIRVLFGRQGLEVRHYASPQSRESAVVTDYDVEWMKNGHYVDWNTEEPVQGAIRLRVTVKGLVFKMQVYYVPFVSSEKYSEPIWRDFDRQYICTALEGVDDIKDDFKSSPDHQESDTLALEIGHENAKIYVDVYRPVILRELYQEGHLVKYYKQNEDVEVPLLNCNQFSLRDFSKNGVKTYSLTTPDSAYYRFTTFNEPNISAENYCEKRLASQIWTDIPLDYLKIYIAKPCDHAKNLWKWNYGSDPIPVENAYNLTQEGIVFQSLKDNASPIQYAMPTIKKRSGWGGKKQDTAVNVLKCFETVCLHHTYFFLFNPLIKCVYDGKQIHDILLPILTEKQIDKQEASSLYLFATQFHFDWMLLPRVCWEQAIEGAARNDEELQTLKDRLIQFFALTPKANSEREQSCLEDFLKIYWTFNDWPNTDDITHTALQLILGKTDAMNQYKTMRDFLIVYDECKFKFSEMSKAVVNPDKQSNL